MWVRRAWVVTPVTAVTRRCWMNRPLRFSSMSTSALHDNGVVRQKRPRRLSRLRSTPVRPGRAIGGSLISASAPVNWHIVTKYARQTGLVNKLAPHGMRRTCAKLCRESGGDLEQIQFLLGHASIQTTERYLGSRQNLKEAVNHRLGLDE